MRPPNLAPPPPPRCLPNFSCCTTSVVVVVVVDVGSTDTAPSVSPDTPPNDETVVTSELVMASVVTSPELTNPATSFG